jgi:hypothetical protein
MAAVVESFRCVPLACTLALQTCARRHALAVQTRRGGLGANAARVYSDTCATCTVGDAHERGDAPERWPDGTPIVRVSVTPPPSQPKTVTSAPPVRLGGLAIPRRPTPIAQPAPALEDDMPKTLTHNGITDSIDGWARRISMSGTALRARLAKGMSPSEALTRPKADPVAPKPRGGARVAPGPKPTPRSRAKPEAAVAPAEAPPTADPVSLLVALGWDVRDLGKHPAGRLLVVGGLR